jgi:TonB family protein
MKQQSIAVLAAAFVSCAASAQTLISMPELVEPTGLYGAEYGVTQLAVSVSADGKIMDMKIQESSGLPPLDKKALAAMSAAKFSPKKGADGQPVAGTVVLPVQFGKPPGKTDERLCRSWSGELRAFAAYSPQRSLDELKSVAEIKSLLLKGQFSKGNPRSNLKDRTARLPEVFDRIVTYCRNERTGTVGEIVAFVVEDFKY